MEPSLCGYTHSHHTLTSQSIPQPFKRCLLPPPPLPNLPSSPFNSRISLLCAPLLDCAFFSLIVNTFLWGMGLALLLFIRRAVGLAPVLPPSTSGLVQKQAGCPLFSHAAPPLGIRSPLPPTMPCDVTMPFPTDTAISVPAPWGTAATRPPAACRCCPLPAASPPLGAVHPLPRARAVSQCPRGWTVMDGALLSPSSRPPKPLG